MKKLRSLILLGTAVAGARAALRSKHGPRESASGAEEPGGGSPDPESANGSTNGHSVMPLSARSHSARPTRAARSDSDHSPSGGGIKARLAALPVLGPLMRVQDRFSEVHGNELAAAITLQAFLALFPLVLVALAVVGFLAAGSDTDLASRLTGELGLTGQAASALNDAIGAAQRSRKAASVVGFAGLLWSGLGLVGALQYGLNQVWQVKERGLKDKAVGIVWLVGAALLFLGTAALTTALRWLPGVLAPVGIFVALAVNLALWMWTAKILPNRTISWKGVLRGALVGALGVELLKVIGAYYVPRLVASSSQLYGSLGIVFAILVWLLFFGRLVIYSAVVDVMAYEREHGTVEVALEVPNLPGTDHHDEANRLGRVQ